MRPVGQPFEAIQKISRSLLQRLFEPVPRKLYHYTSGEGLHNILRSNELRGSNYSFMNDRSEFRYGANLLREVVEELAQSPQDDVDQDYYEAILTSKTPIVSDLYLVCFCTEGDLLSQWRGYGSRGSRYCLLFAPDEFEAVNGASPLLPVCYDKDVQRGLLKGLLAAHLRGIYDTSGVERSKDLFKSAASCTYACCIIALAVFKDYAFHEEHEWRSILLARPGEYVNKLEFWSSGGVMKPTLSLLRGRSPGKLPLREVLCGASAAPEQAIRSAELMLARYDYPPIEVNLSRIPLSG